MSTLTDGQRRLLESTVRDARVVAESGAREALAHRTVGDAKPGEHLDESGRRLRRKLRAHARQLGDAVEDDVTLTVDHLTRECAYAHWHRMLFARFLAENGLLLNPDDGGAIALEELDEWAAEWKLKSRWEAAERCASRVLPQIFGASELVLSLDLPRNRQTQLEALLEALPREVFQARDALGWVYQFWQSAEKERLKHREKVTSDELPSVTQHFTEPYMVEFLLQNTLGAWWVGRHGAKDLPVEMPYLRLLEDGKPAAGTFDDWPKTAKELKVLDPCCGSGHFLVAAFDMLVRFRMREEGLKARVVTELVIQDNLHGLELDPRCTQIAAFGVAFAAWTFEGVGFYYQLPEMHIACVGLGIRGSLDEWLTLANGNAKFRAGMERLYTQFADAAVLGSLIDPTVAKDPLMEAPFRELQPLLKSALESEKWADNEDATEYGAAARGIAKAAEILVGRYTLVCTNPPFLSRNRQPEGLRDAIDRVYKAAKGDVATAFVSRALRWVGNSGTASFVLPNNWLFLETYKDFRSNLLRRVRWKLLVQFGHSAFRELNSKKMQAVCFVFSAGKPSPEETFFSIDLRVSATKAESIREQELVRLSQAVQRTNPDARIVAEEIADLPLLGNYATCAQGLKTGDDDRFRRQFWEVVSVDDAGWRKLQSGFRADLTGGRESVITWHTEGDPLARRQGMRLWGCTGVAISQMNTLPATVYRGEAFDSNVAPIVPRNPEHLTAIWAYCSSSEYGTAVRAIDQTLKVPNATLVKVPFDLERWQKVAAEKYADGLPLPHSHDPTQWLFKGDIPSSTRPLQVAIARLVGYCWPDQPEDATLDTLVDNDGLVCLPAIRKEKPAMDRLLDMLAKAYGTRWSTSVLDELLAREGASGVGLEAWLRDRFFEVHCQLFHQSPFVWHVWDGLRDGFGVLIHYQRFTRATLETLINVDLGDWIDRQDSAVKNGAKGAPERLDAARGLRAKLQAILVGEAPYDIFVRWKPLYTQPLGWEPDLDDGVRLNIRPFVEAGILRTPAKNLKIDWKKDRGKDPSTTPWYWLFKGERRNDHHTTLKEKSDARAEKAKKDAAKKDAAKKDAAKKS